MNISDKYKSFLREKVDKGTRRPGVHVSDLVGDCMRKPWYRMSNLPVEIDDDTVTAFYYGTTIHNSFDGMFDVMEYHMYVDPFKEIVLSEDYEPEGKDIYKCVSGSLDAIHNNTILDFKTCSKLPSSPSAQYMKQINFYSYMYYLHTGIEIKKGAILYLEKMSGFKKTKLFEFDLMDKEVIRDLMRYKLDELSMEKPPERNVTFFCNWCPFITTCKPNI